MARTMQQLWRRASPTPRLFAIWIILGVNFLSALYFWKFAQHLDMVELQAAPALGAFIGGLFFSFGNVGDFTKLQFDKTRHRVYATMTVEDHEGYCYEQSWVYTPSEWAWLWVWSALARSMATGFVLITFSYFIVKFGNYAT